MGRKIVVALLYLAAIGTALHGWYLDGWVVRNLTLSSLLGAVVIAGAAYWYQVASRPVDLGLPEPGTKPIGRNPRDDGFHERLDGQDRRPFDEIDRIR